MNHGEGGLLGAWEHPGGLVLLNGRSSSDSLSRKGKSVSEEG